MSNRFIQKKHEPRKVYLLVSFIQGFFFTMVWNISQIYFVVQVGMDPLQLVLLGTALETAIFIFEVPTGVVADLFSRKISVIIGAIVIGSAFILEGSIPSFTPILFSQAVWGLGWTFISGALAAWVTDEIGLENTGNIFIRGLQIGMIGNLVAIPISLTLGNIALTLPILGGGLGFIFSGIFLVFMMSEEGFTPAVVDDRTTILQVRDMFLNGINLIRGHQFLAIFGIVALVNGLASEGYDRLQEPHLMLDFSFPQYPDWSLVTWISIINILGMLISVGIAEFMKKQQHLEHPRKLRRLLQVIYGSIGLTTLGVAFTGHFYLAISFRMFRVILRSMVEPLQTMWINQYIESKFRATVLSITGQL
ncbi:MAG: MFS transporter [Anaerolineales bacterium]|nr:MFS transporter [Anaerolineales bacterium]